MAETWEERFERDPDWWWLQLRFALRDGRLEDAGAAQRKLAELGVEIRLRGVQLTQEVACDE